MQKQNWTHIILGLVFALVAGLNYTYGLKINAADALTAATTLIGIFTILAEAIITHGKTTSDKSALPAELLNLLGSLSKILESASPKQTGTAPTGATVTTQPPPTTGN